MEIRAHLALNGILLIWIDFFKSNFDLERVAEG